MAAERAHDAAARAHDASEAPWWARPGLEIRNGRLAIAGRDAEDLTRRCGTPCYVFDLVRIREQVEALRGALSAARLDHRIRFALKANREPEVLAFVRGLGKPGASDAVGIDACSPGEVGHARAHGWLPQEISLTGTNLTDAELLGVLHEPVHVNADLLSQLRRVGRLFPGRNVGLRVNPQASAVRGGDDLYSGARPTKFGVYPDDLGQALEIAREHELRFDTVHFHVAWACTGAELPGFERAVEEAARTTRTLREAGHPVEEVNVGGGLGVPFFEGDERLDLQRWAGILARHLGPLGVVVAAEPGEFLVKEAGVLLAEVVSVEERLGSTFVGLNVGWNAMAQRFVYDEEVVFARCREPAAGPTRRVTFSGNINEGDDVFEVDYPFPPVEEGDVVAMLGVGAYNQAMAHEHCLRSPATAIYFEDRV
jgi:diaminopimelate decarboxylase